MATKNLKEFTDIELLKAYKKLKTTMIINCVLIIMLIGTSIFYTLNKGLGIFTFFPLFFIILLSATRKVYTKTKNEVISRGLH